MLPPNCEHFSLGQLSLYFSVLAEPDFKNDDLHFPVWLQTVNSTEIS